MRPRLVPARPRSGAFRAGAWPATPAIAAAAERAAELFFDFAAPLVDSFRVKSEQLTIAELAKKGLPRVVRDAEAAGIQGVTRHGKAVIYLVSRAYMESILETMELLQNKEFMALVRRDKAGKVKYKPVPAK